LLDRETTKNLLATLLLTGTKEPEHCVVALTSLLLRCGFNKREIQSIKNNMELEERILENKQNSNNGGSIFGWFGAAPPTPPPSRRSSAISNLPTRDEMLNASMMDEFDTVNSCVNNTIDGKEKSTTKNVVQLDLS
tara:strand:+ start:120 stop:527 length:408 start_codon:yes stop_codon:yes gene_type:complete